MATPITKNESLFLDEYIDNSRDVIIIGHKSPDGDCVSSVCLLGEVIKKLYDVKVHKVLVDEVPERLSIIPTSDTIKPAKEVIANATGEELLIIVDTAAFAGIGITEEEYNKFKNTVLIDHHMIGNITEKVELPIVHSDYTSCTHIIFDMLANVWGYRWLNLDTAKMAYIGMNTDSLNFTVRGVDNHLFGALEKVTKHFCNDEIEYINKKLYRSNSRELFEYKLSVLNNVKFREQDNGIGVAYYVCHDGDKLPSEASKLTVALYNDIEGYEVCYYIKAVGKKRSRISCRSRNRRINVAKIMEELFGGGGHYAAAGAMVDMSSRELAKFMKNYTFEENESAETL